MKKILFIALSLLTLFTSTAEASGNPWSDCGIGAAIFTKSPTAAAISNIIWDLGTTAVSSNTITPATCANKSASAAMFIGVTYANLEVETVRGQGQHLKTLLNIYACQPAAQSQIIQTVRHDFAQSIRSSIYAEQTNEQKAESYYNLVQATVSGKFAAQCQTL